jgi:DHA3 family macrolide efflux protein-like MFS transporter
VILFWTGTIQIWHIYVISFIRSLGGAFHFPAMNASTALMVPEKHLSRINGINQALNGALGIVAPPLGAILVGMLPMHAVLSIDFFTAMIAILPLLFVVIPEPERKLDGAVTPRKLLQDVREGLVYVSRFRGLLVIMLMASMINFLFNPAFSLMPLLVTRVFKGGALQLGFIESAMGIGVIVGGLALGVWGGFKRQVYTSVLGLFGMGVGTLVIAFAPGEYFWLALAGMALLGVMNPIANGPLFALLQGNIRADMQGRVFTLVGSCAGAMSPLGLMVAAPLVDTLGIQFWYMLGGISVIVMAASMLMVRSVLRLEEDLKADAVKEQAAASALPVPAAASD